MAATFSMDLADKSQPGEYLQCTVNSNTPDAGILMVYQFIDSSRGAMLMVKRYGFDYLAALGCELVPMFPQYIVYSGFSKFHFNS
jgi:hypothetical protein